MSNKRVLVLCKKYNNSTNVLFMMDAEDFRLTEYADNYTVLCEGKYRKNVLHTEQGDYKVFNDWSVKKVA